jgi:hypothetical protein
MFSKGMLWLITGSVISLPAFGQNALNTTPIPSDPLEMATGQIRPVAGFTKRTAVLSLLGRARELYALRSGGTGYELKVTFTVNSGGQTDFDGTWEMEDVFDPKLGLRWTARASASYAITRISSNGMLYGEQTATDIPLRLEEARAALFDPIPPSASLARETFRTSKAVFNGVQLTCILFGAGLGSGNAANAVSGRRWEETEECIDPQSGLLRVHSQVPGRYYAYDYSHAVHFAGRILPGKVTVNEAGRTVTEISVDSLTELTAADPSLFDPTDKMKERGWAIALAGAQKLSLISGQSSNPPDAIAHVVCVFGVVTASGQLVEAHSLQPSDPNSQAAVEAARQMYSSPTPQLGAHPQQHFIFVIEKFASSQ